MTRVGRRGIVIVLIVAGSPVSLSARGAPPKPGTDAKSVEDAVLAASAEMTRAGEAVDADRLFSYVLDNEKGSIVQNGVILATRQEALERVRNNLRGISRLQYQWKHQYVTVLSPEIALLVAEGDSVATTTTGQTFTTPFAQTVVFVLRAGAWKAIHAHQSSPRVR